MPIPDLVRAFDPPLPADVLLAAGRLRYRDLLTVLVIVDRAEVFPDNWIYVHEPDVQVGRIQNFKNWSPEMVPDPARTSLGLEYFLQESDALWSRPDGEIVELATRELATLGLASPGEVVDHAVVRVPRSYPAYDTGSLAAVQELRGYLAAFGNLQLIGRNGQHRYNNQDHSMVTGILAARNVAGAHHDVWSVNLERSYHEEVTPFEATGRALVDGTGSRLDELLDEALARYDPVALGGAVATVAAGALFLATAVLLLRDGQYAGPTLSLLANYLFGFQVSWPGAFLGAAEAGVGGFAFGYTLARLINLAVEWVLRTTIRECRLARALDPLDPGDGRGGRR